MQSKPMFVAQIYPLEISKNAKIPRRMIPYFKVLKIKIFNCPPIFNQKVISLH